MILKTTDETEILLSHNAILIARVRAATQTLTMCCLVPAQVECDEFQQESVLKQLEVLQEEDKEYQHIKVRGRVCVCVWEGAVRVPIGQMMVFNVGTKNSWTALIPFCVMHDYSRILMSRGQMADLY